jgi:putative hydrolase of the HAD superfamily
MRITAITFDFWNTLYADDRGGHDDVHVQRLEILAGLARDLGVQVSAGVLEEAYRSGFEAYLEAWRAGRHFGAPEQVEHVLGRLGLVSYDGLAARAIGELEELGAQAGLRLLPGAAEAIPRLAAEGVKLGLISDTGLTPGRVLTSFLERDGLLPYFGALTYSDETGYPKPDRRMFLDTLARLGATPGEAAHVGDMPRTDVAGAQAVGMVAVRYRASNDYDEPPPADAVISDHRDLLPAVREALARRRTRSAGPCAARAPGQP